ncbi:MAG TPA: ABC transporter ATP-binding protein [Phycisphaerales bacterium]|nr:ABC transporter ATP-binding protein [Phycisphaerales bacterium]
MTVAQATNQPGARVIQEPPATGVIDIRGVTKTYYKPDGSVMAQALRGVDVRIEKGEFVAIMGASGSGKSTLMNVLGCLDRPSTGDYYLDGKNVARMDDAELSRYRGQAIGFIFQAFNLIPELTIEGNVEVPLFYQHIPPAERRARALEALKIVQLDHRTGHRPKELSGGQMQRVAIARALVTRPVLLLADEPTGNLDSSTGQAILEVFDDLHAAGMTIIVVTHDSSVARRCQRVVRLADGLVESDSRQTPVKPAKRANESVVNTADEHAAP